MVWDWAGIGCGSRRDETGRARLARGGSGQDAMNPRRVGWGGTDGTEGDGVRWSERDAVSVRPARYVPKEFATFEVY